MGDKRKATDDDVPGTGQPHQRARTETTAVDDTSQAPAEPTATAAGSLQPLPGPAGAPIQFSRGGRGGGSGHGGFSQSAPMTMLQQPLRNQGSSRAAPTAGAGDAAARVSAVGPPDAWHGALAPPPGLGNPALGRGGGFCPPHWSALPTLANHVLAYTGEPSTRHAPAAYATRPPFLPALGHGRGGNPVPVTIQSLVTASRRRFLERRQHRNASAPQGQLDPHRGQSSSVAPEQQHTLAGNVSSSPVPALSNAGAPQGQQQYRDSVVELLAASEPSPPAGSQRAAYSRCEACRLSGDKACMFCHNPGPPPPPPGQS